MLAQRTLICNSMLRRAICHTSRKPQQLNPQVLQLKSISSYGDDPKNNNRVYFGSLTPRVKTVKLFSLSTSLTGLFAQPILMEQGSKLGGTVLGVFMCGFAGFFTFVTPFLLHIITKRYVTEMYYDNNTKEYKAITLSLFLRRKETVFKAEDVVVPEVPGMLTSFHVKGKSLFVDPSQFTDTDHYIKLMGFDKPIDFKFNVEEMKDETEKK